MSIEQSRSKLQSQDDFFVRKGDLDDIQFITTIINEESWVNLNRVYNYPNLLRLFETSYISLTVFNNEHKIIGCACFNDSPPGLRGKFDDKHENLWEDWLYEAFNLQNLPISSYNTLWVSFLYVDSAYMEQIEVVTERIFQNLYVLQPQLDGILFLRRGEVENLDDIEDTYRIIRGHFFQFKLKNREILKKLIGISYKSKVFYSPKSHVNEQLEIRMARQEDHDDLAEIFNKQSEVLTSQFGEFFIADLIATQNLTRRMTKGSKSQGKAIVGQVKDKAIGLMSVSTQIDYNLLNSQFDLSTYENLLKSDLLEAIQNRYRKIEHDEAILRRNQEQNLTKLIDEERAKSLKIGQRVVLQNFCLTEKEAEVKGELETILTTTAVNEALNIQGFWDLLKKWTTGFELYIPSDIFEKYPEYAKDLESFIMSPAQFLIETLEIFGLPRNYMKGEGHWKDWAEKIQKNLKAAQLRRPKKQTKRPAANIKKKGGKDEQKDEEKPPSYFDVQPFKLAFEKFMAVGPEIRTIYRHQTKQKQKQILMLFCDEKGEMVLEKSIDLNTLGKTMVDHGIPVSNQIIDNMSSMLEAFGGILYNQQTVKIQVKEEEKKNITNKKQTQPKFIDAVQKLVSYDDYIKAIKTMTYFDIQLGRLGYIRSGKLDSEIKQLDLQEQETRQDRKQAEAVQFNYGNYVDLVETLEKGQLPQIPYEANNAIVINLFCIDQIYEARSLQFVEFAFTLFPERDYIIITQPFTITESTLVQNFIQVNRKKNSSFQHCLYLFHKDSLYAKQIKVRRSDPLDIEKAQYLLSDMINKQQIQKNIRDSIINTSSKYVSFSVNCASQLIGIYTISKNVNLDYYVSHFFVQDQMILNQHPRQKHGKVIHSFINPLFTKTVRFILRQIMRLTNKSCLYFQVHNRTLLPDIFNQFTPLRLRTFPQLLKKKWNFQLEKEDLERKLKNKGGVDIEREAYDQEQAPFSLSMISKKNLNNIKISNNTRIVVVGASDTGISFIESLLTLKDITFTNITLLSPGGLITMHANHQKDYLKAASTNYTLDQIKNLMIDARTTVLDAKMVKLDKKNKKILIDRNVYIPFDLLILSVGLIDTLLQNEGLVSCGLTNSPYYKDKKSIPGVYSIDDPYLHQHFALESINIKLLKRKKKPQNITIYGRTPHTIAFISGLLARGVDPQRIYYVCPGSNRRRMQIFQSNQQRIQYESKLTNDPDPFQDINVQKMIIDQLRLIGVSVQLGFEFYEISGNPCTGIKFRKKADNYQELDELIKKKRLQIQLKQQETGNKMAEEFDEDSQDLQQKISPEKQIQLLEQQQWKQLFTPSSFFITSGLIDIDRQIFNIIHENGLVYNGRLIVKSNFQTTQNQIFACGRICQFSQRYKNFAIGKSLRLDRYNGRELGAILSKHVLDILNLSYLTTQKYTEDQLPKFHMPVGIGSALPNNMVYYYIKKTDNSLPKVVFQKGIRNQQIISKNISDFKGHYIKFSIDSNRMIQSVSYLGSEQVIVPSLMSFVGLSIEYLNKVGKRNDHGLITDIVQFLSENWAICLYHQLFSEFRHYIKKSIISNPIAQRINNRAMEKASQGEFVSQAFMAQIKDFIPQELIHEIRNGTINFIQKNNNHLPMYHTPLMK